MDSKRKNTGANLITARIHVEQAQQLLELAIKAHFPIGADCLYRAASNHTWRNATVNMHGYNGDVRIELASGRLVWVRGAVESKLTR